MDSDDEFVGRDSQLRLWAEGLTLADPIKALALQIEPDQPSIGRTRHPYGNGPFAKLGMPSLPAVPGLYVWDLDGEPVYVGQTRSSLRSRLGSNGYATISTYNTFARQPGKRNGGQQTNCRVNHLANDALSNNQVLSIWFRTTTASDSKGAESAWMREHGTPPWNLRSE